MSLEALEKRLAGLGANGPNVVRELSAYDDVNADPTPADLPHIADVRRTGRSRYSVARALAMSVPGGPKSGLEYETSQELGRLRSRPASGIYIPWDAPLPDRYNLTTVTGAGAVPAIMPETLFDALRNKMVLGRLGAQIGDFRGNQLRGMVDIPVKSAASTVSWTTEGNAPASQSNMSITQAQGEVHMATAYTDVTRTMLFEGRSRFRKFVVDDLVGSIAHAIDQAGLAGAGAEGPPLGLAQIPTWPEFAFSGGTPTYKGLTAMKRMTGQNNADAAPDARMGWLTSNVGREALEQTDLGGSATTGRYAWRSHACRNPLTGDLESIESLLGQPAAATESIPYGLSGDGYSNATALFYGNFRHILVQLFGAMDVIENPFLLPSQGIVRFTMMQPADILFLYPTSSFTMAVIDAPNP